jgi:long-chain acyl-CoA synthetase
MQLLLTDSLRRAEQLYGRNQAAICGEVRLTYAEFGARCRALAAALQRRGVGRGDRVATLLGNCHRYLEAYTAIPMLGAVIVPLNTRHAATEQRAVLEDCEPRLLIADAMHRDRAAELGTAVSEVLLAPDEYDRALAEGGELHVDPTLAEDDLAAIYYTGGTTGRAKGVMLSHRNLVANAFNITIWAGYGEADTYLHAAPMFHLADGCSIYALTWWGARHAFAPSFDPGQVLDQIARERVTCTVLVPTMIGMLVENTAVGTTDLSSLRLIIHGGSAISTALLRRGVQTLRCSFTQAYGLTEASSHLAVLPREENLLEDLRARSAGRAVMGAEVVVRRTDGTSCAPGEVGEVTGRGPNFTCGYWNQPEETARALRDGWFWTGDLAHMDEEGYVYIVDRAKDMIISGGENVSTRSRWRKLSRPTRRCWRSLLSVSQTTRGVSAYTPWWCSGLVRHQMKRACRPSAGSGSPATNARARSSFSTRCRNPAPARSSSASCARVTGADTSGWSIDVTSCPR